MKEKIFNILYNCIFIAIFIVLLVLELYVLSIIPLGAMFYFIVRHHKHKEDSASDVLDEEMVEEENSSENTAILEIEEIVTEEIATEEIVTEESDIKENVEKLNAKPQEAVVNNSKVEVIVQRIQQDKAAFEKKKAAASFDWEKYAAMCNAHLEHVDEMEAYKNDDRYKNYV